MGSYELSLGYVLFVKILTGVIAVVFSILGYKLFVSGVGGKSSLIANSGNKFSFQLVNAAPGLFFLLAGAVLATFVLVRTEVRAPQDPKIGHSEGFVLKGDDRILDVWNGVAWMLVLEAKELKENAELRRVKLDLASVLVGLALEGKPGEDNFIETSKEVARLSGDLME